MCVTCHVVANNAIKVISFILLLIISKFLRVLIVAICKTADLQKQKKMLYHTVGNHTNASAIKDSHSDNY